jgi:hypothetical protein
MLREKLSRLWWCGFATRARPDKCAGPAWDATYIRFSGIYYFNIPAMWIKEFGSLAEWIQAGFLIG